MHPGTIDSIRQSAGFSDGDECRQEWKRRKISEARCEEQSVGSESRRAMNNICHEPTLHLLYRTECVPSNARISGWWDPRLHYQSNYHDNRLADTVTHQPSFTSLASIFPSFFTPYSWRSPTLRTDQRHCVCFRQHKGANTPLYCFVTVILDRIPWDADGSRRYMRRPWITPL